MYWERVECTIGGLADEIRGDRLERQHIIQIEAIVLGDAVW